MGAFYLTCLIFIFGVLGSIAAFHGFSIWKLIKYIKEELFLVLGTSSSESALPRLMAKMENAGAEKSVVGLVVPTGYSFNLDGTSIYLTMAAVFIAQATNTPMDLTQQITLLVILLLTSKGAAGVTGSGFIVLAATLSAVGTVPVAGLALILGIDRFMSEARALTNFIGNSVATLVVAKWVKALDTKRLQAVLNDETQDEADFPELVLDDAPDIEIPHSPSARSSNITDQAASAKNRRPVRRFFFTGAMWKTTIPASYIFRNTLTQSQFIYFATQPLEETTMKISKLLIGLFAGALSLAAYAQQPIVIKFSHVVANDTPKGKAAEFFAKKAAELTKGKVKVEVYANSTLYKDKEEMEALQLGAVQMLAPSLAKFGPLGVKEFEVFDLPFIFDNYDDLHKVTRVRSASSCWPSWNPRASRAWRSGTTASSPSRPTRRSRRRPTSRARRCASSRPRCWKSRCARSAAAAGDGLLRGLSGAADRRGRRHREPDSNLYTQKMHEVQKHLTLTDHGYLGYAVIVNKKFWDGLPADVRGSLRMP
jgi:hypothetical protein